MLNPLYQTDRRGFLRVSAAGVMGTVPGLKAIAAEDLSSAKNGFGRGRNGYYIFIISTA